VEIRSAETFAVYFEGIRARTERVIACIPEEHEVHHRGQIYLMLGMLGIPTPPLYGLTSEEVRERSTPV